MRASYAVFHSTTGVSWQPSTVDGFLHLLSSADKAVALAEALYRHGVCDYWRVVRIDGASIVAEHSPTEEWSVVAP